MAFHPYSQQHLITVLIGFAIIAALLVAGRRGGAHHRWSTALLVFLNLSAYPLNLAAWLSLDQPLAMDNYLPFHLCDIAAVTAGFALITRNRQLCMLTYFWGLAATFQGLLTPALSHGFPDWPFFTFFTQHCAIVATALYLPIVDGWRPQIPVWKSPLEVYAWSIAYLAFSLAVNVALGTNFGFSIHPPNNPSLIDHLGPWPWYLFSMQAIGLAAFLLLAMPFCRSVRQGSQR